MLPVMTLVAALQTPQRTRSTNAAFLIAKIAGALFLGATAVALYGLGIFIMYLIWTSDQGIDNSLVAIAGSLALVVFVTQIGWLAILRRQPVSAPRIQDTAQALRSLIIAADDQFAPLVPLQPRPLAPPEIDTGGTTIAPIRQIGNGNLAAIGGAILATLIVILFLSLCGLFNSTEVTTPGANHTLTSMLGIFVPLGIILIVFPVVIVAQLAQQRGRGTTVIVTADEVSWQTGTRMQTLPWREVQALAQITSAQMSGTTTTTTNSALMTTYILISTERAFIWRVTGATSAHDFAASEQLLRYVVTYTGQPLRDITTLTNDLARYGSGMLAQMLTSRISIAGDTERMRRFAQAMPITVTPTPRAAGWRLMLVALIVFLVIDALLPLGAARIQAKAAAYDAHRLALVQAQPPLVHDALTSFDAAWILPDTQKRGFAPAFTAQGLRFGGDDPGNFEDALYTGTAYTDGVFEVTTQESGKVPTDGDGTGIIFHADILGQNFAMFHILADGHWDIYRYAYVDNEASDNWHWLDEGYSAAINKGVGARNTLLVIAQGNQLWFYANGTLVENYQIDPAYDHLPTQGYAGVYLNDAAMRGDFTDFNIYAIPPHPDFWTALLH